ncbi:MAG: hypothetical protein AAF202_10880, partial [Pseudomonadota bacterium]
MNKSARNCLIWSLALLLLPMTFGTPAYSAGYDDDGVEIEVQKDDDENEKPPSRSRKRFSRKNKNEDRDSDRAGGRDRGRDKRTSVRRGDSGSRSRGSQPRTGPGNARFGKTEGKVRFVLVDDPTKEKKPQATTGRGFESKKYKPTRKKISLGPDTETAKSN